MWCDIRFAVWISLLKVTLGGVVDFNVTKDVVIPPIMTQTDHSATVSEGSAITEAAKQSIEDDTRVSLEWPSSQLNVQLRQGQPVHSKPVKTALSNLLVSFAEAFSKVAALPIAVAISLVNKVSNATNSTLYFGGEITKLPVTITNSIIDELSNITFPN